MDSSPPEPRPTLSPDVRLLFTTRIVRLFAYGLVSVVLVLHLAAAGLSESPIGLLLTLTLLGDAGISLWITTRADRAGRRRMLLLGAALMVVAGVLFASTRSFVLLLLAATFGVISPSGNEVGPFLAVEQAALAQSIPTERRTSVFAWYNLAGSLATAVGSLCGGVLADGLQGSGVSQLGSYRALAAGYAVLGLALAGLFLRLSSTSEAPKAARTEARAADPGFHLGLETSRNKVFKLAGLFTMDSFAGGFVVQAFVAYWFQRRFGVSPSVLGAIFFGANLLAGLSALMASRVARRIGLLAPMIAGPLYASAALASLPFLFAGGLKIVYDVLIWRTFRKVKIEKSV